MEVSIRSVVGGAQVIDMREWAIARARNAKVRKLIAAIERYCKGQGPHDALAMAMVARRLTESSWIIVEQMAGVPASSAITRQLVLDELEDRARTLRLAAIIVSGDRDLVPREEDDIARELAARRGWELSR